MASATAIGCCLADGVLVGPDACAGDLHDGSCAEMQTAGMVFAAWVFNWIVE